jgi:hypothetical protein
MNIEILNWPGPPWEVDYGGVKRTGRGETVTGFFASTVMFELMTCSSKVAQSSDLE